MLDVTVRRVAVLGSGTLGGALAAHLTNLGLSVTLIDASLALATSGLERVRASFYIPERMGEIRLAGYEESIPMLEEADWIVEALPERLVLKKTLYARIAPYVRPDAVVTTCSSSLRVTELIADLPEAFASRFLATCFAFPLAQNPLVEVRPGPNLALAQEFSRFLSEEIARKPLIVPDGVGGPYLRYGIWNLFLAIHTAEKLRLDIEDVEAMTALAMTGPGVFGTVDRMGLDLLRDVATNAAERLPGDRGVRFYDLPDSMIGLIARGWTGAKAGRGFTRREGKDTLTLNLTTMAFRQAHESSIPSLRAISTNDPWERLRIALSGRDEVGEYLRDSLLTALRYAEYLRETTNLSVVEIDRTMEWGFGWRSGPFRMLDALGMGTRRYYDKGTYLASEGYVPIPTDDSPLSLDTAPIIDRAEGYSIHDLGDGIEAVALNAGSLTPERVRDLNRLLDSTKTNRFVLTTKGSDFPELDLAFILGSSSSEPAALDAYLSALQILGEGLERIACVAAIPGRCTGAVLGLALSCSGIVAVADTKLGFDESRVGLLPTARGTAILRSLYGDSPKRMSEIAANLAEGLVAENADAARVVGYLRPGDRTEHRSDRLLETAKNLVRTISVEARRPFVPIESVLVGMIDRNLVERRQKGMLTEYEVAIGQRIRQVLARTSDYEECLERERRETVELCSKALTQARLRHRLEVGKPIRN